MIDQHVAISDLLCPWCREQLTVPPAHIRGALWHPPCADIFEALDPGIREVVYLLRVTHGFYTCDSGDGHSKPPEARAFPVPHVAIAVDVPENAPPTADRVLELLGPAWHVEASYCANDRSMLVLATTDAPDGTKAPDTSLAFRLFGHRSLFGWLFGE